MNLYDYDGRTPLNIAASEGHLESVMYLVRHGADVNHRDCRGNTALDDARREKHSLCVEFLENFD